MTVSQFHTEDKLRFISFVLLLSFMQAVHSTYTHKRVIMQYFLFCESDFLYYMIEISLSFIRSGTFAHFFVWKVIIIINR